MSLTLIIVLCVGAVLVVALVNACWAAEKSAPSKAGVQTPDAVMLLAEAAPLEPAGSPAMSISEPVLTHPSVPLSVLMSDMFEPERAPVAAAAQLTASASLSARVTYVQYTEIILVRRRH
ncbi:hypothetical protein D1224_12635 [Henriciella barbarensis]|uniref:Uncharacterized protein n=1 Tax=Henriciella barbarensis TaxID=86342 RepID=A0A399QTN1_9PROT|nr:hypothetical protein [Henriciella barbarensis]RIJ21604.1 hypothetical protein D1224_12635 [Henriciella barbarensis]